MQRNMTDGQKDDWLIEGIPLWTRSRMSSLSNWACWAEDPQSFSMSEGHNAQSPAGHTVLLWSTNESFSHIGTSLPEMFLSSWGLLFPRCFCCSKPQIWFCSEMIWKTGQPPWEMNGCLADCRSSLWLEPDSYWVMNSAEFLQFAASFGSTRHAVVPALSPVLQVSSNQQMKGGTLCANNSNFWTQNQSKN